MVGLQGVSLDKILADHRDQQEKVAEEMIKLTQSLKEQSAAAGSIIRGDTGRREQSSVMAENNLDKQVLDLVDDGNRDSHICRHGAHDEALQQEAPGGGGQIPVLSEGRVIATIIVLFIILQVEDGWDHLPGLMIVEIF